MLAGGGEGGNDTGEAQHEGLRVDEARENGQTVKPAKWAQEETPTSEDPQAPGHWSPKDL